MRFSKGPHGSPIPSSCTVMRVCKPQNMDFDRGVAHPGAFTLSTADKAHTPIMLSVYASELTTPKQAIGFIPGTDTSTAVFYLGVEKVRKIKVSPTWPSPDVVWDDKYDVMNGQQVKSTAPGADGHCGILNMEVTGPDCKKLKKQICVELAAIATLSPGKSIKARVFRVLKWLALALAIAVIAFAVFGVTQEDARILGRICSRGRWFSMRSVPRIASLI